MTKGYQIIEIDDLNDFPNHLLVPILLWIISNVSKTNLYTSLIELKIIKVTYLGSYYSIGVKYLTDEIKDFEPVILENFERIKNNSMNDFFNFIKQHSDEIEEICTRLSNE